MKGLCLVLIIPIKPVFLLWVETRVIGFLPKRDRIIVGFKKTWLLVPHSLIIDN
ncbi:hypothetical protein Ple7327_1278 [Pleurocapsa sp. PCC 7327]|nr:hypothetical protein Ple7327_1278 [Pleurocapsa sp. PCC 7327]